MTEREGLQATSETCDDGDGSTGGGVEGSGVKDSVEVEQLNLIELVWTCADLCGGTVDTRQMLNVELAPSIPCEGGNADAGGWCDRRGEKS